MKRPLAYITAAWLCGDSENAEQAARYCRAVYKAGFSSMSGQSLHVELQRQFRYKPAAATASAFVQQRGKLFPSVFEEILRRFTLQNRPKRQWNGYTLLAVDGSHVQIPSDIHDE